MKSDTDIGGPQMQFLSTSWTAVLGARDGASPALEQLIRAYWKPVYFLIRRRGHPVETAKDLTQGFFTAFLERNYLQYVRERHGKFRWFLRVTVDHYLADEHDRQSAQKRGGGATPLPLDFADAEVEVGRGPAWDADPDRLYCRKWALAVMRQALDAIEREYAATGRSGEFDVLIGYVTGGAGTYADGARRLDIPETDFANRLHRLRKRYREAIIAEVRASTETETEAQEELRDLFSSLGA